MFLRFGLPSGPSSTAEEKVGTRRRKESVEVPGLVTQQVDKWMAGPQNLETREKQHESSQALQKGAK